MWQQWIFREGGVYYNLALKSLLCNLVLNVCYPTCGVKLKVVQLLGIEAWLEKVGLEEQGFEGFTHLWFWSRLSSSSVTVKEPSPHPHIFPPSCLLCYLGCFSKFQSKPIHFLESCLCQGCCHSHQKISNIFSNGNLEKNSSKEFLC